jgi:hypothetical protein
MIIDRKNGGACGGQQPRFVLFGKAPPTLVVFAKLPNHCLRSAA